MAMPLMLNSRVEGFLHRETRKGCDPQLFAFPLALEPEFFPIAWHDDHPRNELSSPVRTSDTPPHDAALSRLQVWLSPDEESTWLKSELFLKQLSLVGNRIGFEIIGNRDRIHIGFLVHRDDLQLLGTSYRGTFERCELTEAIQFDAFNSFAHPRQDIHFLDVYPPPPYSHLLTRPDEFRVSPFQSFLAALMEITPPDTGFYQALFQPAHPEHNWHRNVEALLDMEYMHKLITSQIPQRYFQQAPSGDLRQMARDVETKSHNDKPFYFLACRIGVIATQDPQDLLRSLSVFFNLFQHGGRPMKYLSDVEYRLHLSNDDLWKMFRLGLTYRPGFLVNSAELSGPVHLPPADILGFRAPRISQIETLPVSDTGIQEGTPVGTYNYLGEEYKVCIPMDLKSRSNHIIGRPGMAKSTTMAHMILDDIARGIGVAVIDPHGDLIEDLLIRIPREHIERTIYFDLTIPDHVPIWNPLHRSQGQDISRTTEDIIAAFKTVFQQGWGDRMEHLFRHGLYALAHIPGGTLQDLSVLLFKRDKKSKLQEEPLLELILQVLDNDTAKRFWLHHVRNYSSEAFDPPKHRLDKILLSGKTALMLSQPNNRIDLRRIMDSGGILLVKLSLIGREVMEILGCFLMSLLHLTALGRSDTPVAYRKPFQIYVDEAHRFVTDALEDLIAETRKFGVGLTLAHHYFSQFGSKKVDALSSVGTTIIMNVDRKDAGYLVKDLRDEVSPNDLTSLKLGEAIVRIGTEIVKIKTLGKLKVPEQNFKDQIIRHSLALYYEPENAVREAIRKKNERYGGFVTPLTAPPALEDIEIIYDEGF
jgi:hypothetical protein